MKISCLLLASILFSGETFAQVDERQTGRLPNLENKGVSRMSDGGAANDPPAATFRSAIDLVALNVVVTDARQNFVSGLTAEKFAVFEDGVRQDVSFFAAGEVPLDLAILLDTSASMTDKLRTAQQAAIGFASTLREQDRLIAIDIKDGSKVIAPLTADHEASRQAILRTSPSGGTALYNGLYLALKEMTKQRRATDDVRRQAIVVLSDGEDTASLLSFDDVMELARQSGIAVYTITLKSKWMTRDTTLPTQRYFSQSEFAMKTLAQETGGRAFFPTEIAQLSGVYADIADELASQYAIGYTSKNPRRDGAYRRVIVRIDETPGAQTRTRAGYTAARTSPSTR